MPIRPPAPVGQPVQAAVLRAMLADLKMPGALEAVDGVLAQVDSGAVTAGEAIELVLNAQIALRNNRRLQAAMRSYGPTASATTFRAPRVIAPARHVHDVLCVGVFRVREPVLRAHGIGRDDVPAGQEGAAQFLGCVHGKRRLAIHSDVPDHVDHPFSSGRGVRPRARSPFSTAAGAV